MGQSYLLAIRMNFIPWLWRRQEKMLRRWLTMQMQRLSRRGSVRVLHWFTKIILILAAAGQSKVNKTRCFLSLSHVRIHIALCGLVCNPYFPYQFYPLSLPSSIRNSFMHSCRPGPQDRTSMLFASIVVILTAISRQLRMLQHRHDSQWSAVLTYSDIQSTTRVSPSTLRSGAICT
jgi:hypothetical protein